MILLARTQIHKFTKDHWGTVPIGWCLLYFHWSGCKLYFFAMLPPDMARIAIRVLGQCQKHGASLADDIAKWGFAQFFSVDPFWKLPPITITNTHYSTRAR